MIRVRKLRELTLANPSETTGSRHIAAASSLVRVRHTLFVVADDEVQLGVFPLEGSEPGRMVRILDRHLSEDSEMRKKEKPDFESACFVPAFEECPHGGLLALGSGSTERQRDGALAPLDANEQPTGSYHTVHLGELYDVLEDDVGAVNIEGVSVVSDRLRLLQRGNEEGSVNAHVDLTLRDVLEALTQGDVLSAGAVIDVVEHDLGTLDGVKLCFADSSPLEDTRQVFAASAEDPGGGGDGAVTGSALGIMSPSGDVAWCERLDDPIKVEGVTARLEPDGIVVLMVEDADDPDHPSPLYEARLPADAGA
jgi:hypothetical protein